ncbi:hypothetical protein SAMN05421821_105153 [Mucilaginibacter lappiensis]|uniref:PBP1b-binding outer membrane lipoprotein LpoB n=1 Tax=Mucilaginibacter lappiensis TaxID=354630 RepID=A0ABR6PJ25_9SPHI|nr:hypothetical protein [Mucilaginibacter lappiensis]MBB6109735.1 PBP1b-binding outer membrane lipoprotein LpoB [Mucilaginibacter lappiensis]SIR13618.1 hypothetical protein SAMN05421821_105153 [Mucilaginibacter lappiensis]
MKPKSLILLLLLITLFVSACVKDYQIEPVKNDLTGIWTSSDRTMTWAIENTKGIGYNAKFTELKKSDGRYLRVEMPMINETYKITEVNKHDMILVDSKNFQLSFNKIR